MDPTAEGKVYAARSFTVDPPRVAAFRGLFGGDPHVVPPTFLTACEFTVFPEVTEDPALALDFSRVLHAEESYEWARPLRVGETVEVRPRIAQAAVRGSLGVLTIETEVREPGGDLVARCRATLIERGDA